MKTISVFGAMAAAFLVVGCAETPPEKPTLVGQPVDDVLLRIKQEVGFYDNQINSESKPPPLPPDYQGCGNGQLNLDITKVNISLSTITTQGSTGSIALKIPFAMGAGDLGGGYKRSKTSTATQKLVLNTYPIPDPTFRLPQPLTDHTPIADAILALRNSLRATAATKPCFTLVKSDLDPPKPKGQKPPAAAAGKDDDNTYSIQFEVLNDSNPTLGFSFLIVSATAGQDNSEKDSNTLTFSFQAHTSGPPNPNVKGGHVREREHEQLLKVQLPEFDNAL